MSIMSKEGALATLQLAKEVHAGKRKLPADVLLKRGEIKDAERRVHLFAQRMGVVDAGMVHQVTALKLELDGLYARWAESHAAVAVF